MTLLVHDPHASCAGSQRRHHVIEDDASDRVDGQDRSQGTADGLHQAKASGILFRRFSRCTLGLVQVGVLDRRFESGGDELEHRDVFLREAARPEAAGVQDPADLARAEDRHADQRAEPSPEEGTDRTGPSEVSDHCGAFLRRDASRDAHAERNVHALLGGALEAARRPDA